MKHPFTIQERDKDQSVYFCGIHFLRTGSLSHFVTHRSSLSIDVFPRFKAEYDPNDKTTGACTTATNWTQGESNRDIQWNLDDEDDLQRFVAYLKKRGDGDASIPDTTPPGT